MSMIVTKLQLASLPYSSNSGVEEGASAPHPPPSASVLQVKYYKNTVQIQLDSA